MTGTQPCDVVTTRLGVVMRPDPHDLRRVAWVHPEATDDELRESGFCEPGDGSGAWPDYGAALLARFEWLARRGLLDGPGIRWVSP